MLVEVSNRSGQRTAKCTQVSCVCDPNRNRLTISPLLEMGRYSSSGPLKVPQIFVYRSLSEAQKHSQGPTDLKHRSVIEPAAYLANLGAREALDFVHHDL
jgi:hypothetical protein